MGLCREEPSPELCSTFAGRPWPVTLAGDRGQLRASSRAREPGTGSSPAGAQAGTHSPYMCFCLFLTMARICLQGLRLICTSLICQLRPKWCHLINREFANNQMRFKTLIQPNNSKICHKLQHRHSQPSFQGSCIHPHVLENNNKKSKIWERRIKNILEDGMKTQISCCRTILSPPEQPFDRDDSPRPGMELPSLCHS